MRVHRKTACLLVVLAAIGVLNPGCQMTNDYAGDVLYDDDWHSRVHPEGRPLEWPRMEPIYVRK